MDCCIVLAVEMLCDKVHERRNLSMRHRLFSILLVFAVATCVIIAAFHRVLIKTTAQNNFTRIDKKPKPKSQDCGKYLKVELWDKEVCRRTFENLAKFPKFPLYPDSSYCTNNLSTVVEKIERTSIKRIQIYFGPIETGFYKLRVRSSVALRIFLKIHHQSPGISLVLEHPGATNGNAVYSKSYFLESRYYFEIVLFCADSRKDFLSVDWLVPGATKFRSIRTRDLIPEGTRDLISEGHVVSSQYSVFHSSKNVSQNEHSLYGYISRVHVAKSFPLCSLVNVTALRNVTKDITVYALPSPPTEFIKDVLRVIMESFQKVVPRSVKKLEFKMWCPVNYICHSLFQTVISYYLVSIHPIKSSKWKVLRTQPQSTLVGCWLTLTSKLMDWIILRGSVNIF